MTPHEIWREDRASQDNPVAHALTACLRSGDPELVSVARSRIEAAVADTETLLDAATRLCVTYRTLARMRRTMQGLRTRDSNVMRESTCDIENHDSPVVVPADTTR